MNPPYKYTVDNTVLEAFLSVKKRQREELMPIFADLAKDPFIVGDSTQKDNTGRDCQVKRFGEWIITYWPEHLAEQVHILDIERLR